MGSNDLEELAKNQEARAKLREQFLKGVLELHGKFQNYGTDFIKLMNGQGQSCKVFTYEQTLLEGTLKAWNQDGTELLVEDMKTPAFTNVPSALIRSSDVIAIKFDKHIPIP